MVIVDTSVWINYFRGISNETTDKIESLEKNNLDLYTTGIIVTEILAGLRNEDTFRQIKTELSHLFHADPIYPETYISAANIYRKGRSRGITIRKMIDCLIAQVAIENGLFLLHDDEDFIKIAAFTDLKIY
jgi:predicted nucleic acid-binding protein